MELERLPVESERELLALSAFMTRLKNREARRGIWEKLHDSRFVNLLKSGAASSRQLMASFNISASQLEKAIEIADGWLKTGVYCFLNADYITCSISPYIFAWGDESILSGTKTAILNSRKPIKTNPFDQWVRTTSEVTKELCRQGETVVSSYGARQFDLVSSLAKYYKAPLLLICPGPLPMTASAHALNHFLEEYEELVSDGDRLLLSPVMPGTVYKKREASKLRDELLIELADVIQGVNLRPGGNMASGILKAHKDGKPVSICRVNGRPPGNSGAESLLKNGVKSYVIQSKIRTENYAADKNGYPFQFMDLVELDADDYLIHLTRSRPGPWPGQSTIDYYRSLAEMDKGSSHTAFDALINILETGRIFAGGRMTRGETKAVSFTAGGVDELNRIIKWRPALIRWNLEPFGLAIKKKVLAERGAKKVIYGDNEVWNRLEKGDRFRFQYQGRGDMDWSVEKEWRLPFDLNLTDIHPRDMVVVVPDEQFAAEVYSRYKIPVVPLKEIDSRFKYQRDQRS